MTIADGQGRVQVWSACRLPIGKILPGFFRPAAGSARIGGVPVMFAGACRTWEVAMDRWTVTVEEAAQMLGISRSSAYGSVRFFV
jgi:hypothetical protein